MMSIITVIVFSYLFSPLNSEILKNFETRGAIRDTINFFLPGNPILAGNLITLLNFVH